MTAILDRPPRQRRRKKHIVNEAGLRAVVAMIELFPERWNQHTYTGWRDTSTGKVRTFCVASWTVHLAGENVLALLGSRGGGGRAIQYRARELLGLSMAEAGALFFWGDERDEHPTPTELKAHITALLGISFGRQELAA